MTEGEGTMAAKRSKRRKEIQRRGKSRIEETLKTMGYSMLNTCAASEGVGFSPLLAGRVKIVGPTERRRFWLRRTDCYRRQPHQQHGASRCETRDICRIGQSTA